MVRRLTMLHFATFLSLILAIQPCRADDNERSQANRSPRRAADAFLPNTTKCFVSIDDADALLRKWQQTAAGRFASQPAVQPFLDDVLQQFQANMSLVRRLGTDWSTLKELEVRGFDWAIVQPDNDPAQIAVVFIGRVDDPDQTLTSLLALMQADGGTVSEETLTGQSVRSVRWPRGGQYERERTAFFLADETSIIASDHQGTLTAMLRRQMDETESLRQSRPYAEIMQRCVNSSMEQPDVRWFIEPFGFVEALRASNGGRRKRGRDLLKILPRQGFAAIQGVGGVLEMNCRDFDTFSQSYIYAPAASGRPESADGDRFEKAARMLSFPNRDDATPLAWIPSDVGSYITLRCRLGEAFEHSKSLVDDLAAQPVFEDVLKSIELDPNGPQVNLREAIVRHLGERTVILTAPKTEQGPDGELVGGRMAGIAIELSDSQAVEESLARMMAEDPGVQRVMHEGKELWVMTTVDDEDTYADDPGGFGSFENDDDDFEDDGPSLFPNRIFFVAHDHLMITTTETLAKRLLRQVPRNQSLERSVRYDQVRRCLADLGAAQDCFRFFIRTSKFVESGYRQLRLSERFDLFEDLGLLMEKVWLSGEKLPPYEEVATDMGDSGLYVHSEKDGWRIVGFLLKNETSE